MKFVWLLLLFLLFVPSSARVITAQSGSRDHIQAAVNRARVGDTVKVPAGNWVFNGGINVNAGITIMGAGRERTTLRRTSSSSWLFNVNCANGERFVLTGFTIVGLAPTTSRGIRLTNHCKDFRIYDNTFRRNTDRAIEIHGNTRGVIDNNSFIDNDPTAIVVFGDGDASWNRPLSLGSEHAVYVEDNYFQQRNVSNPGRAMHIASNNGSRYVFRHNRVEDGTLRSQSVDAHGNKFYWPRGSRSYEIYNNTFDLGHRWVAMYIRGGDGVIFGNTITGSVINSILLIHEGRSGDGNCNYPCVDQIRQLHIWDNTFNGNPADVHVRHPSIVRLNRDYFLNENQDYEPFTYPHPLREEELEEPDNPDIPDDSEDTTDPSDPNNDDDSVEPGDKDDDDSEEPGDKDDDNSEEPGDKDDDNSEEPGDKDDDDSKDEETTSVIGVNESARRLSLASAISRNGTASINYTLPTNIVSRNSQVRFNIYNARGRLVNSFNRNHSRAGSFSVDINRYLNSGVYQVEMIVGSERLRTQMVLTR
ncbi:hypothetical protein QA601_17400 [Chitinispirillales bacterium ANBcel5]|uniref:glycosyl hydrolase family 28-related protein n=1 Tax=Cellulosispirillum alkaliphilum TaxID=3039283 RepID=UPI002A575BD8|nr:hypothetical protein [Chitinispirillales bacterium ANBcel5]